MTHTLIKCLAAIEAHSLKIDTALLALVAGAAVTLIHIYGGS